MIDQFNQYHNMAKEPQLGDSETLDKDNNAYQEEGEFATPEGTAYMKEQIKNNLFGVQSEVGETQEKPNEMNLDQTEQVCNNVDFPIIHRLYTSDIIQEETYNAIVEQIYNTGKLDLAKLTISDSVKSIQGYIDQGKNQENNVEDFTRDHPGFIDGKDNTGIQNEAYSLIAKNYIKIEAGDKDQDTDKKENLSAATQLATNHILETAKSIPRDTQTFKNAIKEIHSDNPKLQLDGFESLYLLTYSYEGITGKAMNIGKIAIKKSANMRIVALREQYTEAMERISIAQNENGEISEIHKQQELIALIKVEADEIFLGDVFQTGALDNMSDTLSEGKEATA